MNKVRTDLGLRIIREATARSKDGRIDQTDFLNHCQSSTRYSLFTPMETQIIFHFAGRGSSSQRLALIDFAQLLDPRWKVPKLERDAPSAATATAESVLHQVAHSAYNFFLGGVWFGFWGYAELNSAPGLAGALGATIVYPIDLGMRLFLVLHSILGLINSGLQ